MSKNNFLVGISNPDDMEAVEAIPVAPVEKNFKHMRESVMSQDLSPYPRIEGYICKVGDESDNLRYFCLNNHYLNYWDTKDHYDKGAHPVGSFDLDQVMHMWFDRDNFDIVFRFKNGQVRILTFDPSSEKQLLKWYQEIDKRVRYFQSLGPNATSEASLAHMRDAAEAQGVQLQEGIGRAKPAAVRDLKQKAQRLGVRRATLAVPAAPITKRFGYRKSVVMSDSTPYPRVQGYLSKPGGFGFEKKYYQLNNEYMNYWKNKDAWSKGVAPLGSYNIIHFVKVTQRGAQIDVQFVNGTVRNLVAPNKNIAAQWVRFIQLRQKWFADINSANESQVKYENLEAAGQQVRRRSIDDMISNVRAKTRGQ